MKPERWQQVEEINHVALERESGQRAAFLKEACEGDETLRKEVESLLACESKVASRVAVPVLNPWILPAHRLPVSDSL